MRKFVFFLVTILMLSSASSMRIPPVRILQPDLSGLDLYADFLADLHSGVVTRTDINFDSWYTFVSFTSDRICFSQNSQGKQVLTYQSRQPFVFWYYPEPSYFDGDNYYYKHNDTWFLDTHNRFRSTLQQDFMGIPTDLLIQNKVLNDAVYLVEDTYQTIINLQGEDGTQFTITSQLDADFLFESIEIVTSLADADKKADFNRYYRITYEQINQPLEIIPPKSFNPNHFIG